MKPRFHLHQIPMSKKKSSHDKSKHTHVYHDAPPSHEKRLKKSIYERELEKASTELAKLQSWVRARNERVCILFEGRDAAGKGGAIKRITAPLNARIARTVALTAPTDREKTQWYFQRYIQHLPSAGEIVLFDRSWYNRAGVEKVMGFATDEQVERFLMQTPDFEKMLVDDGIRLIKYWFSVNPDEQERRFQERTTHAEKRWKLSPMDLESRARWSEYSRAKDEMFDRTSTSHAPWFVVEADDKRRARLNCIHHLLNLLPYEDHIQHPLGLPPRVSDPDYVRPEYSSQAVVPRVF
ncbi:MAG: polyphosphate kinase 2 [Bradymonadia bacterium]|jgi:polyphosphate kinase 2